MVTSSPRILPGSSSPFPPLHCELQEGRGSVTHVALKIEGLRRKERVGTAPNICTQVGTRGLQTRAPHLISQARNAGSRPHGEWVAEPALASVGS